MRSEGCSSVPVADPWLAVTAAIERRVGTCRRGEFAVTGSMDATSLIAASSNSTTSIGGGADKTGATISTVVGCVDASGVRG